MSLNYQISRRAAVLVFHATGHATPEDLHDLVYAIAQRTSGSTDKRVLVDLRQVDEDLKFTDLYALGEQVARRLAHLERLASVVRGDHRTGTSQKVAGEQGVNLRAFDNDDDAMAWLAGGS